MSKSNMRQLNLTINCQAVYNGTIMVPADLSFEEALEYAERRLDDVDLGPLTYIAGTDTLDRDNCDFEE